MAGDRGEEPVCILVVDEARQWETEGIEETLASFLGWNIMCGDAGRRRCGDEGVKSDLGLFTPQDKKGTARGLLPLDSVIFFYINEWLPCLDVFYILLTHFCPHIIVYLANTRANYMNRTIHIYCHTPHIS
jgi:hypothetical protein